MKRTAKPGMPRDGVPTTRAEDLVEEIHGVVVADPYRWLEDGRSEEVRRWVDAQNAHTGTVLSAYPHRAAVERRLTRLLSIGTLSAPEARNGRYFHTRREGADQNQPILYVRDGLHGEDRALVDPNPLSPDATATIDWWFPSGNGELLAYGVSTGGDEKSVLNIVRVADGTLLDDVIPHTRFCSLAWVEDNRGFYYTCYPAPGEVPEGEEDYNRHVFFHRLGTDPAGDPKVYGEERKPSEIIQIASSPDGRYLIVMVFEGWSRTDLYIKDLKASGASFVPVAEGLNAIFDGQIVDGTLYLLTNWEAPRYRLLAVDPARPERRRWKALIPEGHAVLVQVVPVGGRLVARYLENACSSVVVHGADGRVISEVRLPTLGTVATLSGRHDGREVFFDFSSYSVPPVVYRYDLEEGRSEVWEKVEADVDLADLEVRQDACVSKDGTRISIFLVHRKGLARDGSNPTLLYGYGGFNISLTPSFSRALVLWLERGGVYAVANLRGGGEYGEEWHRAGMLDRKQNVFDDFNAAAEWLIAGRYTRPGRLAVMGGSNGGLLVGAALTQRPDLYRAVVCAVPLLDMVRYHRFRIARLWVPEFGSAEDPEQFRWLYGYSPYHRVTPGTAYPAVLITTAESDSRVDPLHARKMAARLQAATSSDRPILLQIARQAGHGIGKPLRKQIDEATAIWSFLLGQLETDMSAGSGPTAGQ